MPPFHTQICINISFHFVVVVVISTQSLSFSLSLFLSLITAIEQDHCTCCCCCALRCCMTSSAFWSANRTARMQSLFPSATASGWMETSMQSRSLRAKRTSHAFCSAQTRDVAMRHTGPMDTPRMHSQTSQRKTPSRRSARDRGEKCWRSPYLGTTRRLAHSTRSRSNPSRLLLIR